MLITGANAKKKKIADHVKIVLGSDNS